MTNPKNFEECCSNCKYETDRPNGLCTVCIFQISNDGEELPILNLVVRGETYRVNEICGYRSPEGHERIVRIAEISPPSKRGFINIRIVSLHGRLDHYLSYRPDSSLFRWELHKQGTMAGWAAEHGWAVRVIEACPNCRGECGEEDVCCFCGKCMNDCCNCPEWREVAA